MRYAIIGGGPSGLAASINLAKKGEVVIFERNLKMGKKLLLTGAGKCNIGNTNNDLNKYHSSSDALVEELVSNTNIKLVHEFINDCGIVLKNKNGYLYPFSESASSVLSCLENKAKSMGVKFRFDTLISDVTRNSDKFIINGEEFDALVVATGGLSYKKTGSDGIGYNILKKMGHTINNLSPSLVYVKTNLGIEELLKGIRVSARVSLLVDDSLVKEEEGEVQFISGGLSGICIFNLSRDINKYLSDNKNVEIKINLMPFLKGDVISFLDKQSEVNSGVLSVLPDGFLDYKLSNVLFKYFGVNGSRTWSSLSMSEKLRVANILTDLKFNVVGVGDFDKAQVTCGGVQLSEVDINTFQSKLVKNLYIVGEVLDLDGDCGGYNLTLALLSGILCGGVND